MFYLTNSFKVVGCTFTYYDSLETVSYRLMEEEFEDFLRSKKISPKLFKKDQKKLFEEWLTLFSVVNPKSFVMQKLYLINDIRRKYHLDKENNTTINEA